MVVKQQQQQGEVQVVAADTQASSGMQAQQQAASRSTDAGGDVCSACCYVAEVFGLISCCSHTQVVLCLARSHVPCCVQLLFMPSL